MLVIAHKIAAEINASSAQVDAAIQLLDEGATVPFIARYRKEVTQGLDDTQLRVLEERLIYLRELIERRDVILNSIREQEKLVPELENAIYAADNKTLLEDLYLPYKPKRRNKAQIAREAGLEPLAELLLKDPTQDPTQSAQAFLNPEKEINDASQALEGARQILMEQFAEDAACFDQLRQQLWPLTSIIATVAEGKNEEGKKYQDYFNYQETIKTIPSHRALALFRGRKEGMLKVQIDFTPNDAENSFATQLIAAHFHVQQQQRAADAWLQETIRWTWKVKLQPRLELEFFNTLRETAETDAIKVFARNLKDLLLASPAGGKTTLGLDPGLRTGVKVVIVDETGKLLEYTTIYPHVPRNAWQESLAILQHLCKKHQVALVSIGNGTASRETDKLVTELIKANPTLNLSKVVVSEAGASVYSASAFAAAEFPDLDVSLRGAVSIARRLQDPLAELVKIEPKAIGVGQYQHDVNQTQLNRSLNTVIEDCVNAVGVDLNTASEPLLARVSGLNSRLAKQIIEYRDQNGAFKTRDNLKKVPRLGDKTFEQAAGFLRIANGDNPLDRSSVHPESYPIIEKILHTQQKTLEQVLGNPSFLKSLNPKDYANEQVGVPTIIDILNELEKPGRDPRPEFKAVVFHDDIHTLQDLKENLILEGVVTNVANFGAFVDIGVHQDGLVHISELADEFVKDPHQVVKAGDIVKVRVVEVDIPRKRIALSMRSERTAPASDIKRDKTPVKKPNAAQAQPAISNSFQEAFLRAKNK